MEVMNTGKNITIKADYDEAALMVTAISKFVYSEGTMIPQKEKVAEILEALSNPEVKN